MERSEVESMFRKGNISILVATSTLAAGVNLPAGRVIIRSLQVGREALGPIQYKQMCGRAGRPGLAAFGESFLLVRNVEIPMAIRLCCAPLPVIRSQIRPAIDGGKALLRVMLELFALRLCDNESDLLQYIRQTMAFQECMYDLHNQPLEHTDEGASLFTDALNLLHFLQVACALEICPDNKPSTLRLERGGGGKPSKKEIIRITRFGRAVVESGLNPDEAIVLYEDLMRARELGINLETNLHLMYLITPFIHGISPDFNKLYGVLENSKRRKMDPYTATFESIGIEEAKLFRWTHQPPKRDDIAQCADRLRMYKIEMQLEKEAAVARSGRRSRAWCRSCDSP